MLNIDNSLILMEQYNITPDELFCIQLILLSSEEDQIELLQRFCSIDNNKSLFRNYLISLQDKGIILKSYKIPNQGDQFIPSDVQFNKNFIKRLFRASFEMGEELFNIYPMFTTIDGNPVSLRGIAKKFDSIEDFYRFYGKSILWNPEKHEEILNLINWGKENNVIRESIASFVINRSWDTLQALKDGDIVNIDYSAVRQL